MSNRRGAWNASVRELLKVFLERSRARVASVLRRTLQVPNERRDVLHALLRVADDEELARLVSAADATGEGKWALMRLGTTALTHHARLGSFEVAGPPMTDAQAQAVIETEGIRPKRRFFQLELEGLEAELRTREVSVDATRIDDRLRAELSRVLRLAPNLSGGNDLIAHHWIHRSR